MVLISDVLPWVTHVLTPQNTSSVSFSSPVKTTLDPPCNYVLRVKKIVGKFSVSLDRGYFQHFLGTGQPTGPRNCIQKEYSCTKYVFPSSHVEVHALLPFHMLQKLSSLFLIWILLDVLSHTNPMTMNMKSISSGMHHFLRLFLASLGTSLSLCFSR